MHLSIYIYIYTHTYIISIISIISSTHSGISMVVIIPCFCDLHGLLHLCMRFACVYEQLHEE